MPINVWNNAGDNQVLMLSPNAPLSSSSTQPQNTYTLPIKLLTVSNGPNQPIYTSIPGINIFDKQIHDGYIPAGGTVNS